MERIIMIFSRVSFISSSEIRSLPSAAGGLLQFKPCPGTALTKYGENFSITWCRVQGGWDQLLRLMIAISPLFTSQARVFLLEWFFIIRVGPAVGSGRSRCSFLFSTTGRHDLAVPGSSVGTDDDRSQAVKGLVWKLEKYCLKKTLPETNSRFWFIFTSPVRAATLIMVPPPVTDGGELSSVCQGRRLSPPASIWNLDQNEFIYEFGSTWIHRYEFIVYEFINYEFIVCYEFIDYEFIFMILWIHIYEFKYFRIHSYEFIYVNSIVNSICIIMNSYLWIQVLLNS